MKCCRKTKQDEPVPKKKKQDELIEDRVEEDIDCNTEDIYFESSDKE